jgi:starvation-inducible outer membrane lipoprotein
VMKNKWNLLLVIAFALVLSGCAHVGNMDENNYDDVEEVGSVEEVEESVDNELGDEIDAELAELDKEMMEIDKELQSY